MVSAISGEETHCIGGQAHLAKYDIVGDTLEEVSDAMIVLRPAPENNAVCGGKKGDKAICVGSNIDDTCTHAASDVPIDDSFDCQNCFAGASMDIYYALNVSAFNLKGVEVGLRGNHLRGALEVHGHKEGSGPIAQGTIDLISADKTAKIHFMIANIIPVDISVSLPTSLDYSLSWEGAMDAAAGVDLDIDLGDHFVTWTKNDGIVTHNTSASVNATPFLKWNSGEAGADILLSLRSSLQVDIDKVFWYHLNQKPQVPSKVTYNHYLLRKDKLCFDADVDFEVNHEADVHFTLFGKDHDIYHFGPEELYHYHKDQAMHKCTGQESVLV